MANEFDQFDDKTSAPNAFDQFDAPAKDQKTKLGDLARSLKSGVQQLPGIATGLADIAPALAFNARPFTKAADAVGEVTGFQPGKWAKETEFSPGYKESQKSVGDAWASSDAVSADPNASKMDYLRKLAEDAPKIGGAYARNPLYTANQVVESVPAMVAGGAMSKWMMVAGRVAGVAGDAAAGIAARAPVAGYLERALPKSAAAVAGGAGEGLTQTGQAMDQATGDDQRRNAIGALASGAGDALIAFGAGKLANRMGFETANTAMAKAGDGAAGTGLAMGKRVAGGLVTEGLMQEAPQSAQEQMWQNYANGRPLTEGIARQTLEGALSGAVMGAGANVMSGGFKEAEAPPPAAEPPTPPTLQLGNTPDPLVSFKDGTVARQSEVKAHLDSLPPEDRPAFTARLMGLAPQSQTPSQAMGLDPAAGPMSSAAALAVDSGAHQPAAPLPEQLSANQLQEYEQAARRPVADPLGQLQNQVRDTTRYTSADDVQQKYTQLEDAWLALNAEDTTQQADSADLSNEAARTPVQMDDGSTQFVDSKVRGGRIQSGLQNALDAGSSNTIQIINSLNQSLNTIGEMPLSDTERKSVLRVADAHFGFLGAREAASLPAAPAPAAQDTTADNSSMEALIPERRAAPIATNKKAANAQTTEAQQAETQRTEAPAGAGLSLGQEAASGLEAADRRPALASKGGQEQGQPAPQSLGSRPASLGAGQVMRDTASPSLGNPQPETQSVKNVDSFSNDTQQSTAPQPSFTNAIKAGKFIHDNGLKDSHEVKKTGASKFEIVAKAAPATEKPSVAAPVPPKAEVDGVKSTPLAAKSTKESAIDAAMRSVGLDPNAKQSESTKLRKEAEKLQKEAHAMLDRIPAGQPVHSTADRNLRERAGEKSRKAAELYNKADALDKVGKTEIDRERDAADSQGSFLQTQAAPEQRTDNTGDMFGGPSTSHYQAAADQKAKKNATDNGPGLFDAPISPKADSGTSVEPTTHAGRRVYPTKIKGADAQPVTLWAVQSKDNIDRAARGEREVGGDSLHDTKEEAFKAAEQEQKRATQDAASKAERDAVEKFARDESEAKKEANSGKSISERHRDSVLEKQVRNSETGEVTTRREWVKGKVDAGLTTKITQEDKIKPMSRAQFNRADNRQQAAHDRKVKEAGKKDVYWIGDFEISKTEHDYAQSLIENQPSAQSQQAKAAAKSVAPDVLQTTPKQYHDAKLKELAERNGVTLAEVKESYDTPAGRDANEQEWVDGVAQAAKDGKELSRATLDKLYEVRPSITLDTEAKVPNGYQKPSARQSEAVEAQARKESRRASKKDSPEALRAKADLAAAMADLGDILGSTGRMNMMPEQQQKIFQVMVRVMDAAFRLGYTKFKDAAKFSLDQIKAALGAEMADMITLDHLQGAYIASSSGKPGVDTKRTVVNVEDRAEIEGHTAQTDEDRAGGDEAIAPELPSGWSEATPGGMATNPNPLTGGIVDSEIKSGQWFVIPNAEGVKKLDGFATREEALKTFLDQAKKGSSNAPSTNSSVERNSPDAATQPTMGDSVSDDVRGTDGGTGSTGGQATRSEGGRQQGDSVVPFGSAPVAGERGDQQLHSGVPIPELESVLAGSEFSERSGDDGVAGIPTDPITASQVAATSDQRPRGIKAGIERAKADKTATVLGDIDNIRAALPQLLPGQDTDVKAAEDRFAKDDGYGMLFTNGTGTGKTFSGMGVVKRFVNQGKDNILIVVPDNKIATDWIDVGKVLGLNVSQLEDTKSAGKGVAITTYANLGENNTLADRAWNLVVADEAHSLMQSEDGEVTGYLRTLRAITLHPDGVHTRHNMVHRSEWAKAESMSAELNGMEVDVSAEDTTPIARSALTKKIEKLRPDLDALRKSLNESLQAMRDDVDAKQGAARPRAVFLSATPFAYEKTIDWANGYLFDYNDGMPLDGEGGYSSGTGRGYNSGNNRERYFMSRFGYSMRYNKLTRPDAKVDSGIMQRQWNTELKRSGALSGRMLDVKPDYDRRFVTVESAIGNRIDAALSWLEEQRKNAPKDDDGMASVADAINSKFKYLQKRYLLEAIKADEVVPIVKQHMAMGRKVVVFHDYKKGGMGGVNPFRLSVSDMRAGASGSIKLFTAALSQFNAQFSDLVSHPFADMDSPIEVFRRELPQTMFVNGNEKAKDLLARYKSFQDDSTGPQVMLVQSAKNKGWSGHDTTGQHQRVLINLGQPTAPTLAIQQEGRIYRTGQASDAIMRYLNTGTNWERWTFASTIASRASTAENLGMGEMARALKDSFIQSFEESDTYAPGHDGEGKGGKERDKAANNTLTEYDRAKSHYWATQKKNSRTKAQEGTDYFATPEPIGLKMVQWLDARAGESLLEPSGGHGAISRWFPEKTSKTVIEPSLALRSRLALAMNALEDRIIDGTFEDHSVMNKYDGIAMNPPFGTAGRTAVDHIAKAATHLRDGGRIVALLPDGPAATAKFDKWFYEKSERAIKPIVEHPILGLLYRGDTVTTRRSGASGVIVSKAPASSGEGLMIRYPGDTSTVFVGLVGLSNLESTGKRTESYSPADGLSLVATIKLPQVAFERAGTSVATRIVVIEKGGANVMQRDRDLSDITDIKELFDRLENMDFPARSKPVEATPEAPELKPKSVAKEARAEKAKSQSAEVGSSVELDGKPYPVAIYTTNAGKEIRGAWVPTRDIAAKFDPRPFQKRPLGWFVRERDFPRDALKASNDTPAASRPRFSLGAQGQATGVVEAKVAQLTADWENPPKIVVAFDMNDERIDASVRAEDQRQRSGGATGTPEGFYYKGVVYLMSSKLATDKDIARVLAHESLGHYGLRGLYGKALKPILQQIATFRKAEVAAKIEQYGLKKISKLDRLTAAEEVLAEMAQNTPTIGFVKRAVAAIRTWLRTNMPGFKNLELTDDEIIRSYILPARGWVERGGNTPVSNRNIRFSRGTNDTMTQSNDVVGNQGGRSADDSTPGAKPKHSLEQMAKWAEEKRLREEAYTKQAVTEWDTNKRRRAEWIDRIDQGSAFSSVFTDQEKSDIKHYALADDFAGAYEEGRNAAVSTIERALKATGINLEKVSVSGSGKGKSIYARVGDKVVRVSDHELPLTPQREHNRSIGLKGKWDREVIVSDWQNTPIGDYLAEIKGESTPSDARLGYAFTTDEQRGKPSDGSGGNTTTNESTTPDGDGVMFSRSIPNQPTGWDVPEPSTFDDVIYKMQDKHIDTKRVVDAITSTVGKIKDSLNVYLQEELFHGRAASRVADFGATELKPMLNQMKMMGVSLEDIEEFLHARHAKEANAIIAQRDPGMSDGGSGMTNKEADAYMANLPADQRRKLEAVAKKVDAMIAGTRQLYADYNLEDQAKVDGWGTMFKHYVPLMREGKEGGMGIGQGFTVKGKEVKGRTGSTRKVVDILANIAAQREKVIVRGEKNRVATALVGLAAANPNPLFWEVRSQPPTERVYDAASDSVVDRPDSMFKQRANVVTAKVKDSRGNVTEQSVVFDEDDARAMRMASALKNLDAGQLEGLLGVSAKITRYFSAVNTQYNPVFGVVNLVRDVQGAMINLYSTPLADKKAVIAKDTLAAMAGIYKDVRAQRSGKQPSSPWSKLWAQMQEDGGTTGYRELFTTSADRAADLKKIIDPDAWASSKWGKVFTADGRLKVPVGIAKQQAGALFDWLSDYNEAMENGVRLASYKAALDSGMTREQAASLSKNLTVNFNRKGQVGQQAGALYAFFNAAMQGTARIVQTLFEMDDGKIKTLRLSKTGKAIVAGGVTLGVVQALMLAAAGFDDNDPPDFVRERSLIIPTGGKTYVSIPMPLGLHVIPGIGRNAAEFALSGFKNPAKRAISVIGMMADAFNPIGNAGLSMQTLAPTVFDPLVALTENKDFTGKPIARISSNRAVPGHSQWKDTASGPAKVIAEAINWITGGDQYLSGAISPTPDQIDYLWAQVTGGVGREASKVAQSTTAVFNGEDVPTFKVPLVGRFYGNADSQASEGNAFYGNLDRINAVETKAKAMRKDGKVAEAVAYLSSQPESKMIFQANVAERQIQKLKREKRALIEKSGTREEVKAKEEQITAVMARLNRAAEARMVSS